MNRASYGEGMKADVVDGLVVLTLDIRTAEWIVGECCTFDEVTRAIARQVVRAALDQCPQSLHVTEMSK